MSVGLGTPPRFILIMVGKNLGERSEPLNFCYMIVQSIS